PNVNLHNVISSIFSSVEKPVPNVKRGLALLKYFVILCLNCYTATINDLKNFLILRSADRFKQKVQFILLDRNLIDILDACKVADFVVLIMSAKVEVGKFGELCLKAIQAQGIPFMIPAVM